MPSQNNNQDTLLRQWIILGNIPQFPRKITVTELLRRVEAEGFDVTKRTIERNLQTLSLIFPLYSDVRSRPYGWSWQPDARTFSLPAMSPSQALVLSLARDHLTNLLPRSMMATLSPYFTYADNVLLSGEGVKNMANWRDKAAIVPSSQPLISPEYSEELLETVHSALFSEKKLEIDYFSRSQNTVVKSIIHPLGLVQRGAVIYLVATYYSYRDIRILALHRIQSAKQLESASSKPKGFCLHDYITQGAFGFASGGKIRLHVRFTSEAAMHLRETPLSPDQQMIDEEGHVRIEATVSDTSQLRWWLLAFGDQAEVIEPIALREEFIKTAESMHKIYQDKKSKKSKKLSEDGNSVK